MKQCGLCSAYNTPLHLQLEELDDWVNPVYLDIGVQHQIRRQFEKESQIQLPDFFLVCGLPFGQHQNLVVACLVCQILWTLSFTGMGQLKSFHEM